MAFKKKKTPVEKTANAETPIKKGLTDGMTFEEATAALEEIKGALTEERKEFKSFLKKNKLKVGKDYSTHKELGEEFSAHNDKLAELQATREELMAFTKENKPRKERQTQYDYPEGVTSTEEKKKYRAKVRAEKKRAEKAKAKAEKGESTEKEEAPAKKKAPAKKASAKPTAKTPAKKTPTKKAPAKKVEEDEEDED